MVDRFANGARAGRQSRTGLAIRRPSADDGAAVHALIARCEPLDENSRYCNLLQCTHFAATSAVAEWDGAVCGFVSGYRVPDAPERLFVWQVAVADEARGQALAWRMIVDILARPACRGVSGLCASITPDNEASQALFAGIARRLKAPLRRRLLFDRVRHFAGCHASEELWTIGPLGAAPTGRVQAADASLARPSA